MKFLKTNLYLGFFLGIVVIFFSPFFLAHKLPIPSDALVGLYHPWRDNLKEDYPNGIPFKNSLITDPIRQQYPYRILAIDQLKKGNWPKWNPYSFSGTPHLANIQSATFYPLNALFWLFSNEIAWSILVFLQPILAGLFTFLYLRSLKIDERACFLGAISYSFSGFMIAWLEWNTIGHVALWLPLALLAKDKLVQQWSFKWAVILIFTEISAFLAGHLQTALYFFAFINIYLAIRIWQRSRRNITKYIGTWLPFLVKGTVILGIISIQLLPTVNFIVNSARSFDLPDWHRLDWFLPYAHIVQFFVPDFFGNPTTGNYWGVWNYGEFVGYVGIFPIIMAIFALYFRRDKKTLFFGCGLIAAFLFALPTPLAKIPYQLNIAYLATLQPSRLIFIVDFCLAVLAGLGFDYLLKTEKIKVKKMNYLLIGLTLIFAAIWIVTLFGKNVGLSPEMANNLEVSRRNLILPTFLVGVSILLLVFMTKKRKFIFWLVSLALVLTSFDLLRFGQKFTPFTDRSLLYPQTKALEFIQQNIGNYRVMTTDRRILPPNVSTIYKIPSVDGYDPLYLVNYGELVAAWVRNKPDLSPGTFNRILTPERADSYMADLLGVKYILSLNDETYLKLRLVFKEGETRVYENIAVFPRAFLVESVESLPTKQEVIEKMFENKDKLSKIAFTDQNLYIKPVPLTNDEFATIEGYSENKITISTNTSQERLLVLTDIYYPDWNVFINGKESIIFPVDFSLRGVVVPKGKSEVVFRI